METPKHILHLPDALLVHALSNLSLHDAASATAACQYLAKMRQPLWRAIANRRAKPATLLTPQAWGLPDERALLRAIVSCVQPWTAAPWVVVSDYPWCQLVQLRAVDGRIACYPVRPFTSGFELSVVRDDEPLFTLHFALCESTDEFELSAHVKSGATSSSVVRLPASQLGRVGASLFSSSDAKKSDRLALMSHSPYEPWIPYDRLQSLGGSEALGIAWTPRLPSDDAPLRDAIASGHTVVPPLSADWLVTCLEQLAIAEVAVPSPEGWLDGAAAADAANELPAVPSLFGRLLRGVLRGGRGGEAPVQRLPRTPQASLSLCQLPRISSLGPPPHPLLPAPGLYSSNYGAASHSVNMYRERANEVVLVRVFALADDRDARKRLMLDGEPLEKLGQLTLVCTKACGDMHVPAGACTIYAPLVDHLGNAIEPVCTPEPRWGGFGCLAAPGFLHPRFVRDQLVYFSSDSFGFFLDKAFHRLPDLDGEHAWSAHA